MEKISYVGLLTDGMGGYRGSIRIGIFRTKANMIPQRK